MVGTLTQGGVRSSYSALCPGLISDALFRALEGRRCLLEVSSFSSSYFLLYPGYPVYPVALVSVVFVLYCPSGGANLHLEIIR